MAINLGPVTAYAEYIRQGGTLTKDEFGRMLAELGERYSDGSLSGISKEDIADSVIAYFRDNPASSELDENAVITILQKYAEDNIEQLKGEKGDKGERGLQGAKGDKGDSYILTESDKKSITSDVLEEVKKDPTAITGAAGEAVIKETVNEWLESKGVTGVTAGETENLTEEEAQDLVKEILGIGR